MLGWGKLPGPGKDSLLDSALRQLVKIIESVCSSGIKLSSPIAPLTLFLMGTCPGPTWFMLKSESTESEPDVKDFEMYSQRTKGSLDCSQGTERC